jgi:hypothetical protein
VDQPYYEEHTSEKVVSAIKGVSAALLAAATILGTALVCWLGLEMRLVLGVALGAMIAAVFVPLAILLGRRTVKETSHSCPTCKGTVVLADRMIGLPVAADVLTNGWQADAVQRVAKQDWSIFEAAAPYATVEEWVSRPALFIGLAHCEPCQGPFVMLLELHGLDERGTLHIGGGELFLIDRASGSRLLEIARRQKLMTYGHQ